MQQQFDVAKLPNAKYPFLLKQISGLPEEMDIMGTMPSDQNKFLCVVGSRKHSDYGREVCAKLIAGLRGYPIVVVSGLAYGIDSIAHQAALENGIKTVAFPGSGLSPKVLYPPEHHKLAKQILESGGALVSPFPYDQYCTEWTFPVRNRLMAGMSHAVLIIEGAQRSGTLLTADNALEFGRDILTVPGNIFHKLSYGPHMLLRRGATPITSPVDILETFGFAVSRRDWSSQLLPNFAEISFSPEQRAVIDLLRIQPLSATELIQKTGYSTTEFNKVATELELTGAIKENSGLYKLS